MFESIKRRSRRRTVTVGVATAAVVAAAGGAFLTSQAGAATVPTAYVMLKVPSQTTCAVVEDFTPALGYKIRNSTVLRYGNGTGHDASSWNGTGIVAPVGDAIAVIIHTSGCPTLRFPLLHPTQHHVVRQAYGDYWFDAS